MTRVLVIEDSDDILFILELELTSMGYTVDIAANATDGLELAKANRPDVIVSDLRMPGIDGFEFIKNARQIPSLVDVPAIALTGFSLQREVQRALASGFTTHLTKPVDARDLAQMIELLTAIRTQQKAG